MTFIIQTVSVLAILGVVALIVNQYVLEAKERKHKYEILETIFKEFKNPEDIIEQIKQIIAITPRTSDLEYIIETSLYLMVQEKIKSNETFDSEGKLDLFLTRWDRQLQQ